MADKSNKRPFYFVVFLYVFGSAVMSFPPSGLANQACPPDTRAWTETRLFFGRDIGASEEVSDKEWRDFTINEIIPRFGDGFTVLDASGYWQGESCQAHHVNINGGCEKTKVLLVQYAPNEEANGKLKAIADAYIKRFNQQAVMRSDTPVCTQFITPEDKPKGRPE